MSKDPAKSASTKKPNEDVKATKSAVKTRGKKTAASNKTAVSNKTTGKNSKARYKCCLVVPHYNHLAAFEAFLPKLKALKMRVLVVDDGSNKIAKVALHRMLENEPKFSVYEHQFNRGKGAAMWTGAHAARARGYTHILQIDADGQHNVEDIQRFIDMSKANPQAIISGAPQFDESAPKARVYGRKVTDFWVALETWSLSIKDSLCGFRIYPLNEFETVFDKYHIGKRMDFDTDVMVKSVWEGVEVGFIETDVVYIENGISHFNYVQDNLRLIWLHTRLMLGMAVRAPVWIGAALKRVYDEYKEYKK